MTKILSDLFVAICKECKSHEVNIDVDACGLCGPGIMMICRECKTKYNTPHGSHEREKKMIKRGWRIIKSVFCYIFEGRATCERCGIKLVNAQESSITTESEEVIKQRMDSLVAKK